MALLRRCLVGSLIVASALRCAFCRQPDNAASHETADHQLTRRLQKSKTMARSPIIVVLGLPRSGSQQIHDYFECNGIASAHYCCDTSDAKNRTRFPCHDRTCGACVHSNLKRKRPAFKDCSTQRLVRVWSQFDLESQVPFSLFLPQHFALSALHHYDTNATWILNTRSAPSKWATNVLHWNTDTHRILNAFQVPYYSRNQTSVVGYNNFTADMAPDVRTWSADQLYQELKRSLERAGNIKEYKRRLRALMQVYEKHTQLVRDAVKHFQHSHTLVDLNVDDPQAGEVLAKAFPATRASCWKFDSDALDNDWKDFSFKL